MKLNKKVTFLIACAIVIILEIIVSIFHRLKDFNIKTFLETVTLAVSVIGIFSESKKQSKRKVLLHAPAKNYKLKISFESGIYGGLIGGILSGIVISIVCYYESRPDLVECLKIIPYCAMIGCLFGGLIYLGRRLFSQIAFLNVLWANFFGCLFACIVAGCFSGMLGMWLFGNNHFDFIGYNKIVIASIIAALCLIFGTLIYDYEGKLKYISFSLVIALFLSSFISMLGYLIIGNSKIAQYLEIKIYSKNVSDLVEAGLIIGSINGFVFGLVIGFTVIFYKYWRFAEKQEKSA